MSMYSKNGARIHAENCSGIVKITENIKPNLGVFELAKCDADCGYVARGKKIRDIDIIDVMEELAADITEDQTETPPLETGSDPILTD